MVEFLGCYFGCVLAFITIEAIKGLKKEPKVTITTEEREAPKNISSLSDPMSAYKKYTDEGLYKPIRKRGVNRLEIGRDEDSE